MLRINNGYLHRLYVLLENRHWEIFASKTFNIRKEVNRSFCFVLLILSCLKLPYDALQTLGHWLRHVCLYVFLTRVLQTGPSYSIRHLYFGNTTHQLLSFGSFPTKKMTPKISLQLFIIHQILSLARDWSKRVTWPNITQLKLGNTEVCIH